MKRPNIWLLATSVFCLTACGGDGSSNSDVETKTFEDFADEVSQSAGDDAVDCGIVEIGESEVSTNTCVAEAFINGEAFYSIYELQGVDSSVGGALSGDAEGEVLQWEFDSNPTGGVPASSSEIESTVCVDAELSGSVDTGYAEIFTCAQAG